MRSDYNSQAFTPEEVKQGLHIKLINTLLDYNVNSETHYNDIHITSDGYCMIVEWVNNGYEYGYSKYQLLSEDDYIYTRVDFPDGHYDYVPSDEKDIVLQQWINNHPEWKQNDYGTWYYDVSYFKEDDYDVNDIKEDDTNNKQMSIEDFGVTIE